MRALTWHGRHDVRVDTVPDPEIVNPRDAIIKITSTAICGSDLHLYDGYIPAMRAGDILGHENMGEVVEVGAQVDAQEGPARGGPVHHLVRVAASSARSSSLRRATTATRPRPPTRPRSPTAIRWAARSAMPTSPAAMPGARPNICACLIRDVGPIVIPDGLEDDKVLFLSRHPADRLDGGGQLRHRAGRHRRGVGLRPGRAVRDPVGLPARRAPGHRHRPLSAPAGAGEVDGRRGAALSRKSTSARRSTR